MLLRCSAEAGSVHFAGGRRQYEWPSNGLTATQAELRLLSKLSRVLRHARPPSQTLSPLRAAHEAGPRHSSPGTSMADLAGLLLRAMLSRRDSSG
jgi:hypothetical protein